ncbi:corticosteroid 11-beta-dehydrogenase isozyme 2-like isoform X2 [Trachemys scripta elegans]|uniref:corticosteroid 11-beta-dehydrogenase isozyme 2-like isoform X2 n=1 Tax=Trachemys scripta elegans TaxID=31138 RepID=UPI001553312A|nr:corticosteroid 11-beta-dehydrogenase isozyme 2-like isoform X2 [Trachemys scripta elegans]
MAFAFRQFFLVAADLTLALALSCFLYAFVCICTAFLTCFVIIFSLGIVKKMERNIDIKGRAVVILVSNSSIGRTFARNLDEAGFTVSTACWPPERNWAKVLKEEYSPDMKLAQLPITEDEYKMTMKTLIEKHLSLKGMYGLMKNPSVLMWEEQKPDTTRFSEGKTSYKWKDVCITPAFLMALLFLPVNYAVTFAKKKSQQLLTSLLKSKN